MQKFCANFWCKQSFELTSKDIALLEKCSPVIAGKTYVLPHPTRCPTCRLQRRLAFYNCRSLYRRKCSQSGKSMISIYSPDKKFKAIDPKIWWSDDWDPLQNGRPIDFSRPFLPQVRELIEDSPLIGLSIIGDNVNSDYTNDNYKTKNCYLVFDGEQAESSLYGHTFVKLRDCVDFLHAFSCELCYECVHVSESYRLHWSQYCVNCSDSSFLRDCIGCSQCFGCVNVRQKKFCIFNEQKTEEEYRTFMSSFRRSSHSAVVAMRERVAQHFASFPVKAWRGEQCEDSLGDNLYQCRSAYHCFDSMNLQDCRYLTDCLMGAKDCMDIHVWGDGMELCYESALVGAQVRSGVGNFYVTQGADNVHYSMWCGRGSHDLFGCINLRHKQYCILNVQYTKEEYEILVSRLITHMTETGEWGEFFSPEYSCFGYNETMAQSFFPLQKEEALARGFQWCDYDVPLEADRVIVASELPDDSRDIPDDVLSWAIACEVSQKPFKLTRQELDFYRAHSLPIPRRHPNIRHRDRFVYKNPYRIWQRSCATCVKDIQTTYAPERPEKVLCEECYLREVY